MPEKDADAIAPLVVTGSLVGDSPVGPPLLPWAPVSPPVEVSPAVTEDWVSSPASTDEQPDAPAMRRDKPTLAVTLLRIVQTTPGPTISQLLRARERSEGVEG